MHEKNSSDVSLKGFLSLFRIDSHSYLKKEIIGRSLWYREVGETLAWSRWNFIDPIPPPPTGL